MAEAAALKVASLRDDSGPRRDRAVTKPEPNRDLSSRGKSDSKPESKAESKAPTKKSADTPSPRGTAKTSLRVTKIGKAPEDPGAKPSKPKMRLVNGKLVPVDEGPKLF